MDEVKRWYGKRNKEKWMKLRDDMERGIKRNGWS